MKTHPFRKLKIILSVILLAILVAISYILGDGYNLYKSVIKEKSIVDKIAEYKADENYVKLQDVSKYVVEGVVAVEDKRFYEHGGIDIVSIGRAIIDNLRSKELASGGSTITQQLAKNMYFSQEKKFVRKIAEAFVARDLEKRYKKDEILEVYLNIIYYGDGYYGIKEATQGYLGKDPNDLSLFEASLITGIPNAPSVYQLSNNNPHTYERQIKVLDSMLEEGKITQEEYDKTVEEVNTKMN